MVVKEKLGRRRYILFRVNSDEAISTGEVIKTIVYHTTRRNIERHKAKPWLIQFGEGGEENPNFGILRCSHRYQKEFIGLLNSIDNIIYKKATITTIICSGTLRTTRKKLAELTAGNAGQ